ncbi:MAG: tRNA (adenosine(37)-N6)-dimethylallyltransferase MiaA [Gemmatimonadota bacterium]|nr:MAG: tRNA (adenosine(37)-N6)-dimethylallyltransferase MiaA [Gemmatimonadota bacterium]
MSLAAKPRAIVITGPTGTGKTTLAVEVAERVDGEIISADSRQIYRHMDIGTAKPSAALRQRVPHHGLDVLDPDETYSAGRFARDASGRIEEVRGRGRVPLVVGGTGFFIRALLAPLGPEPEVEPDRRARLRRYLSDLRVDELHRWLERLDRKRAEQLQGEGGGQRIARSLEVVLLSGRRHSWWFARPPETPTLPARVFCLTLPRDELYRRIDERFERMLAAGLLDEVRALSARYPERSPGLKSLGYAELSVHLRGACTLEQAVEEAKRSTHRFARRQLTWFRHQLPDDTIWLDAERPVAELTAAVVQSWMHSDADLARG